MIEPDASCVTTTEVIDDTDKTHPTDQTKLDCTKFVPGSIHADEVRELWREMLKAGEWVMDVLEKGYTIPLMTLPDPYEEPNNASADRETAFVWQAVTDLAESGIMQFTNEKPRCVSPLTVSYKRAKDGSIKKRLCWDGSRCVNLCLQEQTVKLSHFQRALEQTRPGDFQVTYDLKAAYHQIKIRPSQTKYLGAAIKSPDGTTKYFVYLFLPFGLGSAVHCITKLFKPINAYIHNQGIRHSIYIDDGRITSDTKCQAEEETNS